MTMIMKYVFLCLFLLHYNYSTGQDNPYPIQFEDSLTIMFPSKPEITKNSDFSETYVAQTDRGDFSVIVHSYEAPLLSSDSVIDVIMDSFSKDFSQDPNLGDLSVTEKVVKGKMRGRYMKFEINELQPAFFVMYLTLSSSTSPNTYSIGYRYQDSANQPLYDKESFLASVKE